MCKKDEEIVMSNFAALPAADLPLSTKTLRGADILPPVGARVEASALGGICIAYIDRCDLMLLSKLDRLNVVTRVTHKCI